MDAQDELDALTAQVAVNTMAMGYVLHRLGLGSLPAQLSEAFGRLEARAEGDAAFERGAPHYERAFAALAARVRSAELHPPRAEGRPPPAAG